MSDLDLSDLERYKIASLPASFYYIANFLSATESTSLLSKIPSQRWTTLSHRRLQAHPSTLTASNTLIAAPLPPWLTSAPPIAARLEALRVFAASKHAAPNHVLVNEYTPGDGIMAHEDGPAYSPVVATVSLGGAVCLEVEGKREEGKDEDDGEDEDGGEGEGKDRGAASRFRILQEPGSLLVTRGEAYGCLLHGIAPIERDVDLGPETVANWELLGDKSKFADGINERKTRVSLTYRDVLKVSKVGIGVLGKR